MKSSGQSTPRAKKINLVNRDFQLRYARAAALVGLISTVLTTVLILSPLYAFGILRIPVFLPAPFLLAMGIAAIFNIAIVTYQGIVVTNRIAGPMFNLLRHLRCVEEGYWRGFMRVRKGDEMKYVVRNFNGMLEAIGRSIEADIAEVRLAKTLVAELPIREDSAAAKEKILTQLQNISDAMEKRLRDCPY